MMTRSIFLVLVAGTISLAASADGREDEARRARQWIAEGRILSLQQLLDMHGDRFAGRLLDLEVEEKKDRIIYEIEVMDDSGVIREIEIDAATGEILEVEIED